MAYLDSYTTPLTASAAAHLLRRATFGPTNQEVTDFTGKTALEAVDILINNASYRATPPPPVEMDITRSDAGQPFLEKGYEETRSYYYYMYIKYWWIGLMAEQNGKPSILEKLTAFWQNHFVVTYSSVIDFRYMNKYLRFLRSNALGSFKDLAIGMSKDPGMLIFQNGHQNTKQHPNENYARELQELFVVGQKDIYGNNNYLEQDVKAAAQVLTGWQATNHRVAGSTTFGAIFTPDRHDTSDKVFSSKYGNKTIAGRSGSSAGDDELSDLITMLVSNPESPKFICRKLYRWYVNPNVTPEVEDQVITPLAAFFASPSNNYAVAPVIKKLLTSQIFFDKSNYGAIIKSPSELVIGAIRFFNQPVPNITTEFDPFQKMIAFANSSMSSLQLNLLNQATVFGSPPYFQTGYSKNWINETTIGQRGSKTDAFVYPYLEIKPGYRLGIDILAILRKAQPNFSAVTTTPSITCEQVLEEFLKNLFAIDISQSQKDFLIDSIMMMKSSPRTTWVREWDAYRTSPNDTGKQNTILWRCRTLLKYMLRMAEYQLF
jgi:uncharacterized protein (DUF1800 family)